MGSPTELYLRPADAATADFLGEALVLPANLVDGWADCALGRVATHDLLRRGPAQIMLRPEQLQLTPLPVGAAQTALAHGGYGTVLETDFCGPISELTVRLLGANGLPPLLVRSSSVQTPAVGDTVQISVLGAAHVFATGATHG